jgi:hypothetical protein
LLAFRRRLYAFDVFFSRRHFSAMPRRHFRHYFAAIATLCAFRFLLRHAFFFISLIFSQMLPPFHATPRRRRDG